MGGFVSAVCNVVKAVLPVIAVIAPFVPFLAPFTPIINAISTAYKTIKEGFPKGLVGAFVDKFLPGVAPQVSGFLEKTGLTDMAKNILSGQKPEDALKGALVDKIAGPINNAANGLIQQVGGDAVKNINGAIQSAATDIATKGGLPAPSVGEVVKLPTVDVKPALAAA